jgi:hypothetical protein
VVSLCAFGDVFIDSVPHDRRKAVKGESTPAGKAVKVA